jgi:formate hydrogenlyase subunit 6/NADH:ubiquinone oxidoreductase subunit I
MPKGANNTYFGSIAEGIKTSIKGLRLSMRHLKNARKKMPSKYVSDDNYFTENIGTVTLQYPNEVIAVPDTGRYRLYNEMDDCIVCDKCAKVCPVDCIDIEPIKSSELIGNASDGSPIRLYAAKFDIDMAKCCFCGLCTTVCPTECLTMTKAYDFAEFDVKDFNYHYANLSPTQAEEKKRNYEQFLLEKEASKALKLEISQENKQEIIQKPVFRPSFKKLETAVNEVDKDLNTYDSPKPKPVFRPVFQKPESDSINTNTELKSEDSPKLKPVFRPTFKMPENSKDETIAEKKPGDAIKPKPVFRPTLKPPTKKPDE